MSSKKYNPFKDFQSDQLQRSSRKIFTAHYACRNADLNLTLDTGTINGFIFQIINSLIESRGVRLTCFDCNRFILAPGVNVQCQSENMTIIIPKLLLFGIDREHLRLLDTSCKAAENNTHFSLTTPLTGCNTTSRHTPTAIVYSNVVLDMPVAVKNVVTRVRKLEIQFSCFYSRHGVVSSVVWKASNRKLLFSNIGEGSLTLALDMFPNKRFVSPYTRRDFPVAVILRKPLFFEVSVISDDKQLSIRADRCYATPTQDRMNPLKYEFIKQGYDKKIHYSTITFF